MDATLIVIDSDSELARARALVDRLWDSDEPADIARLQPQARLIAAYEDSKWPRRSPSTAELIRHLMDQHGLTRADMVAVLGTQSRVSEVLAGKKGLSMTMVQRLRARFRVPADLLIPPPKGCGARPSGPPLKRLLAYSARRLGEQQRARTPQRQGPLLYRERDRGRTTWFEPRTPIAGSSKGWTDPFVVRGAGKFPGRSGASSWKRGCGSGRPWSR